MRFALVLLLLTACSHAPVSSVGVDRISAASFLGDSFVVDLSAPSVVRTHQAVIDSAAWKLDDAIAADFGSELSKRGKAFVPFALDPSALSKALGVRESRFRKVEGKQSQALLDLLFDAADRQGIRYFFLLTPTPDRDTFPLRRGNVGAACADNSGMPRAYVYFFARFALWDVKERKKLHESLVDPEATLQTSFADCGVNLPDPKRDLEDPAKRTAAALVGGLFSRLGW